MLKYVMELGYQIRVCQSVKLPSMLIQLRPSNKLQVHDKYFFCRLKVLKFFYAL